MHSGVPMQPCLRHFLCVHKRSRPSVSHVGAMPGCGASEPLLPLFLMNALDHVQETAPPSPLLQRHALLQSTQPVPPPPSHGELFPYKQPLHS